MLTAKEARELQKHALEDKKGKGGQALSTILLRIEQEAKNCSLSVNIYNLLPNDYIIKEHILNKLRELGYKVETGYDQRDNESWVTVSWK